MVQEKSLLRFEITGAPAFATVKIYLDHGQTVIAEGGAMVYMDGHVTMKTSSRGGMLKGLGRKLSGESMFQNSFYIKEGENTPGMVAFAIGAPGDIVHLHLNPGEAWTLSKDAYICSTEGCVISTKRGGLKGMFGGEGYFLTQVTAEDISDVWFGGYGHVERHELAPGQEFVCDNGVMMGFTSDMQHKLSKVGGKKSLLLGGEGVVIRYTGPGVVYTQNRELGALASLLATFLPSKSR